MMRTAHELLEILAERNVRLTVAEHAANWRQSTLQVSGKASALTDDLKADLRRLKTTLLAVLLACDCRECAARGHRLRIDRDYASTQSAS